jgi:flagellar biosynthesis/type III secretory pathway M-ring protein FliF/YscJ
MIETGAAVFIVALVLLLAWRSNKKATVARYPLALPMGGGGGPALELGTGAARSYTSDGSALGLEPAEVQQKALVMAKERAQADVHAAHVQAETDRRSDRQNEVVGLIDRQPEDVAQVLRSWLAEKK